MWVYTFKGVTPLREYKGTEKCANGGHEATGFRKG